MEDDQSTLSLTAKVRREELVDLRERLRIRTDPMSATIFIKLVFMLNAQLRQSCIKFRQPVAILGRLGVGGVEKHRGGVLGEIERGAVGGPFVLVDVARAPGFFEAREHRVVWKQIEIVVTIAMDQRRVNIVFRRKDGRERPATREANGADLLARLG